jgi:hypothetical protein
MAMQYPQGSNAQNNVAPYRSMKMGDAACTLFI